MFSLKISFLLCLKLCFCDFVLSHESRKHEHYSFKDLREAVNGDSLSPEDQQRLFKKLNFLNCSVNKSSEDYRQCFTPTDLHNFTGGSTLSTLNSSQFAAVSPVIVYCLLPAREKNSGQQHCQISPRNHSELYLSFARNYSHGRQVVTHHALEHIVEEINKTIGEFLTAKKCFSAESIIKEIKEAEHHDHNHDEHAGEHHENTTEEILDQHAFEKACASIVLHLVQGYCIEKGHGHKETGSKLPSKEFFIKDLFKTKTHLSEDDLKEITNSLGIAKSPESSGSSSSGGHDHGHDHRRRRSAGVLLPQQESAAPHVIHRRAVDDHGHETNGGSGNCYSLDDMLTVFDIDHSTGADSYDFTQLCPAFVQQAKSGACKAQSNKTKADPDIHLGKIWGYGFAAVTLISLTSLVGVATIPFAGKKLYKNILALLVALAVGTLSGDSLLHLLPHAFGLHAHGEHEAAGGGHDDHSEDTHGFIWKALVVLASVYGFFLFETLMHLALKSKVNELGNHSHIDDELPGPSSRHMSFKRRRTCSDLEHHEGALSLGRSEEKLPAGNGDIVLTNVQNGKGHLEDQADGVPQPSTGKPKKVFESRWSQVFRDREGKKKSLKQISPVAWMIIIGDTLHNITDGLAIGAAFNSGISGGISTSIAIFCHELPHELGDFAVLLRAGMSVKMAMLANLLSAMSCYIGLAIGLSIGQQGDARFWIFAIAAGIFLYVAYVDMLPDLMHSETLQTEPLITFLMQNIGLLLGFGIMLIIALYEEDLMAINF